MAAIGTLEGRANRVCEDPTRTRKEREVVAYEWLRNYGNESTSGFSNRKARR